MNIKSLSWKVFSHKQEEIYDNPASEVDISSIKQIGDYILGNEIGSGAFGKVVSATHQITGEKVAIKILDKIILSQTPEDYQLVKQELSILKIVKHKYIVRLYEILETPQHIFIVTEYCEGRDLMDYILTRTRLTEEESLKYFQQLINALYYLHSQNITHRDIKIDNLLLDRNYDLKLIDFGLSTKYRDDKLLDQPCGTVVYAAPEVLECKEYHGMLADVWSSGIVLYGMLSGYLPFCEKDDEVNKQLVIKGDIEIPEFFSPLAKDLIMHMLDINPLTRYTLDEIREHPWFNLMPFKLIPGIIIGFNKIPVDEYIINLCASYYNRDKEKVRDSVINNKFDSDSTLYYLLVRKYKNRGFDFKSDLCSNLFINYIIFDNKRKNLHLNEENSNDFGNINFDNLNINFPNDNTNNDYNVKNRNSSVKKREIKNKHIPQFQEFQNIFNCINNKNNKSTIADLGYKDNLIEANSLINVLSNEKYNFNFINIQNNNSVHKNTRNKKNIRIHLGEMELNINDITSNKKICTEGKIDPNLYTNSNRYKKKKFDNKKLKNKNDTTGVRNSDKLKDKLMTDRDKKFTLDVLKKNIINKHKLHKNNNDASIELFIKKNKVTQNKSINKRRNLKNNNILDNSHSNYPNNRSLNFSMKKIYEKSSAIIRRNRNNRLLNDSKNKDYKTNNISTSKHNNNNSAIKNRVKMNRKNNIVSRNNNNSTELSSKKRNNLSCLYKSPFLTLENYCIENKKNITKETKNNNKEKKEIIGKKEIKDKKENKEIVEKKENKDKKEDKENSACLNDKKNNDSKNNGYQTERNNLKNLKQYCGITSNNKLNSTKNKHDLNKKLEKEKLRNSLKQRIKENYKKGFINKEKINNNLNRSLFIINNINKNSNNTTNKNSTNHNRAITNNLLLTERDLNSNTHFNNFSKTKKNNNEYKKTHPVLISNSSSKTRKKKSIIKNPSNKVYKRHLESSVANYRKKPIIKIRDLSDSPKQRDLNEKTRNNRIPWKIQKKGIDEKLDSGIIYSRYISKMKNNPFNKYQNNRFLLKRQRNNSTNENNKKLNNTDYSSFMNNSKNYQTNKTSIINSNANINKILNDSYSHYYSNVKKKPYLINNSYNNRNSVQSLNSNKKQNSSKSKDIFTSKYQKIKYKRNYFNNCNFYRNSSQNRHRLDFSMNLTTKDDKLYSNKKITTRTVEPYDYTSNVKSSKKFSRNIDYLNRNINKELLSKSASFNSYYSNNEEENFSEPFDLSCLFVSKKSLGVFCGNFAKKLKNHNVRYNLKGSNLYVYNKKNCNGNQITVNKMKNDFGRQSVFVMRLVDRNLQSNKLIKKIIFEGVN